MEFWPKEIATCMSSDRMALVSIKVASLASRIHYNCNHWLKLCSSKLSPKANMTQYVSDLQALADRWGKAFSAKYGTSCRWVDLHARRSEMANYQQYKISAKSSNVRYEGSGTAIDQPGIVTTDSYTNNTSAEQSSVFKYSKATTNSFTWTLKEGIEVGISVEFAVGVPPVASGTTTLSSTLSFEATQSKTEEETITWAIDRNVTVPPQTKMEMIWTIKEQKSSATFFADLIMTGYFAIWNNNSIDVNNPGGSDKHYLWFIPINMAFSQMYSWGISVPSQYSISSGSVIYKATGECQGEAGVQTTFDLIENPLQARSNQQSKEGMPTASQSGNPRLITMFAVPAEDN